MQVRGDAELARTVAAAGFDVRSDPSGGDHRSDAVVLAGTGATCPGALRDAAAELEPGGVLVVLAVDAGRDPDRASRLGRVLRTAALEAWPARARLRRRLRANALEVRDLPGLRRDAPVAVAVAVAAGRRRPTVSEEAAQQAAAALGARLATRGVRVLSTGVLLCDLSAPDRRRYLLRVAGGAAAALLCRGVQVQRRLLAAGAPPAVSRRLVPTLVDARLRGLSYTLEPHVDGAHRRVFGPRLLDECTDFLVMLASAPGGGGRDAATLVAADAETLRPSLDRTRAATLARAGELLAAHLHAVPTAWCHGDFWPRNLLVREGRLHAVLDWDAAAADGLPLLDLMHLIALGSRRARRLPHGRRCVDHLWPRAREGGDERMQRYCAAIGLRRDPPVIEALAIAYWLNRVARDMRTFADRPARTVWMRVNVDQPLDALRVRLG